MLHTEGRDFEILLTYMSDYVLVKASADWADEFYCECFWAGPKKDWKQLLEDYKKGFADRGEVEICFGTNESLEYGSFDDWNRENEVKKISEDEFKFLRRVFGNKSDQSLIFGTGCGRFEIEFDEDDDEDW